MMTDSGERIRQRMEQTRSQLDEKVESVANEAKRLADWRLYVKRYPWACVGAALLVGYLAVPRRVELRSPDAQTLLKLAKKNRLVVEANPEPRTRGNVAGTILRFVSHAAMRSAMGYLGNQVGKLADQQQGESEGSEKDAF